MRLKYKALDENFISEFKEEILITEKKIEELQKIEKKTYDNFFNEIELVIQTLDEFAFALGIEISTNITDLGKKTYDEYLPLVNEFSSKLSQNEEFAATVEKILETEELTSVRKRILEKQMLSFKSNGIGLDKIEKEKIKSINLELSKLGNDFSQNVTDATNAYELIIEDKDVLVEMPKLDRKSAELENGTWKFTLHGPSFIVFMKYCNDQNLRETFYKAFTTKASQNEVLIEKILKLKDEKAKILGYKNFRELSVRSKTAKNAKEVIDFLTELGVEALPTAKKEIKELADFAKNNLGLDNMEVYDISYVSRKLKEVKFSFDPSEVKPYFEKKSVINGMMKFLENTFDLKMKKVEGIDVWSDAASVFELSRNGILLGNLIMDLETSDVKRGGAWANVWSPRYTHNRVNVPAIGMVVCNFPQSKNGVPSLLDHSDVVTLFHEMGHALHLITSRVDEISAAGFNGTEWDVVEYPSQWLQEFANNKEVIKTFAKHYETGETISDQLIDKMLESEKFGKGLGNNRQIEFGLFDINIYDGNHDTKEKVQATLNDVRKLVNVTNTPQYNKFQCSFSHIFSGGYSAGYYSYKWAEVLSADSYLEMTKGGKINIKLANSFFDSLLSLGGSVNMKDSFVKVHGRLPDPKALLRLTGIL